ELLETLDISRGTLNGIAANKRELVQLCILHSLDKKQALVEKVATEAATPIEALLQLLQLSVEEVYSFSTAFVQDLQQHYPWAWARLQLFMRQLAQDYLNPLLKQSISDGYLQADLPSEMVIRLFINHLQGLLNPNLFPAYALNYQELFKLVVLYYLRG